MCHLCSGRYQIASHKDRTVFNRLDCSRCFQKNNRYKSTCSWWRSVDWLRRRLINDHVYFNKLYNYTRYCIENRLVPWTRVVSTFKTTSSQSNAYAYDRIYVRIRISNNFIPSPKRRMLIENLSCIVFDLGFRNSRKLRISGPISYSLRPMCMCVCANAEYSVGGKYLHTNSIIHAHTYSYGYTPEIQ